MSENRTELGHDGLPRGHSLFFTFSKWRTLCFTWSKAPNGSLFISARQTFPQHKTQTEGQFIYGYSCSCSSIVFINSLLVRLPPLLSCVGINKSCCVYHSSLFAPSPPCSLPPMHLSITSLLSPRTLSLLLPPWIRKRQTLTLCPRIARKSKKPPLPAQ